MKLLTRTSIYFALLLLLIFGAGMYVFYAELQHLIREEADEKLEIDKELVLHTLAEADSVPLFFKYSGREVHCEPVAALISKKDEMRDTIIYEDADMEMIPARLLIFYSEINGKPYRITLTHSTLETDDLLESIFDAMKILFGVMVLLIVVLNLIVSRSLWRPFYESLEKIKQFAPDEQTPLSFQKVSITEFRKLNRVLEEMTGRIRTDFQKQKQFIENASHEMQTPLSVIRNRLEMLIQSERLTEKEMKVIQSVYEAAERLSRLNKTLLLLSRIENRQFEEKSSVNFKHAVEKAISVFDDLIRIKNLKLEADLSDISLLINPQLADVLINNILQNSIRHNVDSGWIKVVLNPEKLEISNSGKPLSVNPAELFLRFRKGDPSGDSHGLGLAIVKQVCDLHGYGLSYTASDSIHSVTVHFPSPKTS